MTSSVAVERLGRLLADGLEDLTIEHHEEVELPESGLPLKVDYDRLMLLERAGSFVAFGARRDGRLVGYSAFIVGPSLHGGEGLATNDVIFVQKRHRGRLGVRLILAAEDHFRPRGVERITYHVKLAAILRSGSKNATVGDLLLRLGYDQIEAVHAKRLGAPHGRRRKRTLSLPADVAERG